MVTFHVADMTCGRCASAIARAIAAVDKGARIEISIPGKLVSIASHAAPSELLDAIREAGYTPEKVDAAASPRVPPSGGCCCAARAAAPVDAGQAGSPSAGPCCS